MSAVVPGYPTVVHALVAQAERGPDGATMTVVPEPGRAEPRRYDAVFDDALRCAAVLAEYGVRRGDRVLFCLPTSWTFVTAFFGCQLLGAAPTAIAVPTSFGRASGFDGQVKELVAYLRPAAVVARAAVVQASEAVADTVFIDGDVLLERAASAEASLAQFRLPAEDDLAFIQCTSGSTGRPKGVMISHANLAANLTQSVAATGWSAEDTSVSWLPLYHDMGLISGLMVPVYTGSGSVLMPPTQFLRSPVEWLRNITAKGEPSRRPPTSPTGTPPTGSATATSTVSTCRPGGWRSAARSPSIPAPSSASSIGSSSGGCGRTCSCPATAWPRPP
ncbi:hypothetical protein GCM10029963_05210 [Micromonospora andamanensis]